MATVASPLRLEQPISLMLASAFDQGSTFIVQKKVTVSANEEDGMPEELLSSKFILNDECFVDLQIYLKSAMRLPGTVDFFNQSLPEEWFKQYFEGEQGKPKLYDYMRETLVGINQHCAIFWKDTMGPMVTLAGEIANFCDEAKDLGDDLFKQLKIITRDGATVNDPDIKTALSRAGKILKDLKVEAEASSKNCEKYLSKLSEFQAITEQDKIKIDQVASRTTDRLPTDQKLNADLRQKMDEAKVKMQAALVKADENRQKAAENTGMKWYYFIAWSVILSLVLYQESQRKDAEDAIRDADNAYTQVLADAGAQMSAVISLRAHCKNLNAMISDVQKAISKAVKALKHMKSAFSQLQTDTEFIMKRLDKIDDKIIDSDLYQREKSLRDFDGARWRWVLVKNLARGFQQKGLLIEVNLQKPDVPIQVQDEFEILGATFANDTVTNAAKILFNDGEDMLVDSTKMPLIDRWHGVQKVVTLFYTYGPEKRLFVCTERSGEHKFKRGAISNSQDSTSLQTIIIPRSKPTGALYQILAIVWGKEEKKDEKSYNYVYQQMNSKKPVRWNNENFVDGWVGNLKSGVVYYTTDGKDVKILAGNENQETAW